MSRNSKIAIALLVFGIIFLLIWVAFTPHQIRVIPTFTFTFGKP